MSTQGQSSPQRLPDECTCFPVANPWSYYGIVEPGGAFEPNPECPEHFPENRAQEQS